MMEVKLEKKNEKKRRSYKDKMLSSDQINLLTIDAIIKKMKRLDKKKYSKID